MTKLITHPSFWIMIFFGITTVACAQVDDKIKGEEPVNSVKEKMMEKTTENKMKIEIWSDVMCPFCYIGKRNFETALNQFSAKEHIEVVWKSYQLDGSIPEVANESYQDYLVKHKGMPAAQVKNMLDNVTQSAKQVGLDYNFDIALMVNSLNAHKLIQFAKTKGLGDEAEEKLFLAFFTEGKNIADIAMLTQLGVAIGLDETEIKTAFSDEKYANLVQQDIEEAQQVGVQGVPFFVLDRKYAVSGAQPPKAFLENLEKAYAEWRKQNPETKLQIAKGQSCTPDGICE